jgi:hypothetical protein
MGARLDGWGSIPEKPGILEMAVFWVEEGQLS